jgi:hypothetical protein
MDTLYCASDKRRTDWALVGLQNKMTWIDQKHLKGMEK